MFVLWKDHTAVREAELINKVSRSWGGTDFTKYEGGVYSSEWFWSKIIHVLREDRKVRAAAFSWVEHCDWMPALLTGTTDPLTLKRSRCAAGHKAMWHAEWDGLPPEQFLVKLDPVLKGLRERLYTETWTSDVKAGGLTEDWARRLGMTPGIAVAVGGFDAHIGGVGGHHRPHAREDHGHLHVRHDGRAAEGDRRKDRAGICGQVDGSIIPGMIGLEAGQSAFGDVYAWFKDLLAWPLSAAATGPAGGKAGGKGARGAAGVRAKLREEIEESLLDRLALEAAKVDPAESTVVALDWLNGRRTPFADQTLKGAIVGLTLGTTAPKIFRALVEATAFGFRAITDQFRREGVPINDVIALGGIARKSPFVMQVTADVLGMPIKVAASDQTVALGAGMFAAVAAGIYKDVSEAQKKMGSGFDITYVPDRKRADVYTKLYKKYVILGESLKGLLQSL